MFRVRHSETLWVSGTGQSFLQDLLYPVRRVRVSVVVGDLPVPNEAIQRQSGHHVSSGIEERHSAAECTCLVFQSAEQGAGGTTPTRRRSHAHAFDLGDVIAQATEPAAGDDLVGKFASARLASRGRRTLLTGARTDRRTLPAAGVKGHRIAEVRGSRD